MKYQEFLEKKDSEKESKEEKTRRSLSLAQRNGSPTYWNYVTGKTEVTPAISTKKQALSNVRKESK